MNYHDFCTWTGWMCKHDVHSPFRRFRPNIDERHHIFDSAIYSHPIDIDTDQVYSKTEDNL